MARDQKTTLSLPTLDRTETGYRAQLILSTSKGINSKLVSRAQASFVSPQGYLTCELFGDFSKTYHQSYARATQKNIDDQHAAVFTPEATQAIIVEALNFYAAKAAKEAQAA